MDLTEDMLPFNGSKHPLIDSDDVPPSFSQGPDFEAHILRRAQATRVFHEAEAKTMLRLATLARSRTIRTPQLGQTGYYYRRGKKVHRKLATVDRPVS